MKKFRILLVVLLVAVFFMFAAGSSSETEISNQGKESVSSESDANQNDKTSEDGIIGDYKVIIDSCRLVEDYEDKPVVIVKYIFTNVKDSDSAAFSWAIDDQVYQNGVGLNECYFLEDDTNYSADNQSKEIKQGASIEVEVAYLLNDTTTDIEVEVKELISFNDKLITKTFSIAE